MSKKRRNTFQKAVSINGEHGMWPHWNEDSHLLKKLHKDFAEESQRWRRIKDK